MNRPEYDCGQVACAERTAELTMQQRDVPPEPNRLVLFVCTGNTCRSPMAEALFNHLAPPVGWYARSAGLAAFAGDPATEPAIQVLAEDYGIDLSEHRSQPLTEPVARDACWILTMTAYQRSALAAALPELEDRLCLLSAFVGADEADIPDPYGGPVEQYRDTARTLEHLISRLRDRLSAPEPEQEAPASDLDLA